MFGITGIGSAVPPAPGLVVDYERAVAVFEQLDGGDCPVSKSLSLVFYVPRYQQLAPARPPSPPLPFVDAFYVSDDACANERVEASGLTFLASEQYSFERLRFASLTDVVVPVFDGSGSERETFDLDLFWQGIGHATPVTDPANDGEVEPGVVVEAQVTGLVRGTSVAFAPEEIVFAEIGSFHRLTGPAPVPGSPRWDPAADWRDAPNHVNPSPDAYGNPDVWSYLASPGLVHDASQYTPMTDYLASGEAWTIPGYVNLLVSHAGPFVVMHSYGGRVVGSGRMSILAWTSPVNGVIKIAGTVSLPDTAICDPASLGDPGGIIWTFENRAGAIRTIEVPAGGSALVDESVLVTKGETLYFVHEPGWDSHCDSALVSLAIGKQSGS
jgi:hypothetical protein